MAASFGKNATCVIGDDGLGRCTIEGASLAEGTAAPRSSKPPPRGDKRASALPSAPKPA